MFLFESEGDEFELSSFSFQTQKNEVKFLLVHNVYTKKR